MSALGLGLGLGLGLSRVRGGGSPAMILVYAIPESGTNIELAIQANSMYFPDGQGVVIDWGDGSAAETVSAASDHTGYVGHTYASAGTYAIQISGSMTKYGRGVYTEALNGQQLLTHIHSFGELGITSFAVAFNGCSGIVSAPKTLPDSVRDMRYMFYSCTSPTFNPDVSAWNVSKVTSMTWMFGSCRGNAFNPDVSNWDVRNVENMDYMFRFCSGAAFNPNMESWTLKTGVTTTDMFTVSKTQPTTWLDKLLIAWATNPAQGNNITINFSPNKFTEVEGAPLPAVASALATLTTTKNWIITTANPYPAP